MAIAITTQLSIYNEPSICVHYAAKLHCFSNILFVSDKINVY